MFNYKKFARYITAAGLVIGALTGLVIAITKLIQLLHG